MEDLTQERAAARFHVALNQRLRRADSPAQATMAYRHVIGLLVDAVTEPQELEAITQELSLNPDEIRIAEDTA